MRKAENMSLIMEEEIAQLITQIKESSRQSFADSTHVVVFEEKDSADAHYMSNEMLQASIDKADVIKSCSEDHPISR